MVHFDGGAGLKRAERLQRCRFGKIFIQDSHTLLLKKAVTLGYHHRG